MASQTPRFLVTAGNTREMIDRVRDWGNIFTGSTGLGIARALARHGHVDLLTSNAAHLRELDDTPRIAGRGFRDHADLRETLAQLMRTHDYSAVFMTAAVSDYRPAGAYEVVDRRIDPHTGDEHWTVRDVSAGKVKSDCARVAFIGERTEKLIDLFRTEWGYLGLLVKFKLEVGLDVEEQLRVARRSRVASGADYLVANTMEMTAGDKAGAFLVGDDRVEWISRPALAERLAFLIQEHAAKTQATSDRHRLVTESLPSR